MTAMMTSNPATNPPRTTPGAAMLFSALCARCSETYDTDKWSAPWECPDCAAGRTEISYTGWDRRVTVQHPMMSNAWGAGS